MPIPILFWIGAGLISAATAAAGYSFGSSSAEERYNELMEKCAKQARLLEAQDKKINTIMRSLEEIQRSRNAFQKFVWFVFKTDPKLYRAYSELQASVEGRNSIVADVEVTVSDLRKEFPDHPAVNALVGKI